MKWRLNWRGAEVAKLASDQVIEIMSDVGLAAEGNAKRELAKGHGVITGTLRRSIHAATPGYGWSGDAGGTGERGGSRVRAERSGGRIHIEVGSGLEYAMAIHQGWSNSNGLRGSFSGYHYLTNGVEKTRAQVPAIVTRWKLK
jgi:hypothetical protein